jgi:ubiquinone/menaquinone biosynthesis C-methylase UbiE
LNNNTKSAFNSIAERYNYTDSSNVILTWMRSIVHEIYLKYIPKNSFILELNAGTGIDAVFLAQHGYKIYAADISDKMISVLNNNAREFINNGLIKSDIKSFDEISEITECNFDAVISNFGGLNCINNFAKLSNDLSNKLKPDGLFIAVVMNKIIPWEIIYFMAKLNIKQAFRRFNKNGIFVPLNNQYSVLTYYFTPAEFYNFFKNNFKKVKLYSLALKTPPPYLAGFFIKFKTLLKIFMKIDNLIKSFPPFNYFGDHFILIMRKK